MSESDVQRLAELMQGVAAQRSDFAGVDVECCLQVDKYGHITVYERHSDNSGSCVRSINDAECIMETLKGI